MINFKLIFPSAILALGPALSAYQVINEYFNKQMTQKLSLFLICERVWTTLGNGEEVTGVQQGPQIDVMSVWVS